MKMAFLMNVILFIVLVFLRQWIIELEIAPSQ